MLETIDFYVNGLFNKIILWILAASGVVLVADAVGFLPERIQAFINRNRLQEELKLLSSLGVDIPATRRNNIIGKLENINKEDLKGRVESRIKKFKINHKVSVGSSNRVSGTSYYDLMGATTDHGSAEVFARDITALWRRLIVDNIIDSTDIKFIITPKAGSPLLGAAVAKILQVPLLLHNNPYKFSSDPADPRAIFDCFILPEVGSCGLIVDDSSTGGSKALQLIQDVKAQGWVVNDFLVVFEPMLKASSQSNAACRLKSVNVSLHSILKT